MWPETMTWHEVAHQAVHQSWWRVLDLKAIVPIVISLVALFIVLYDRRANLALTSRKGNWNTLRPTADKSEVIFKGIVEVYNVSARANAIQDYEFWGKRIDGDWEKMESELYKESIGGELQTQSNVTPVALAPYSGTELAVMAFTKMPQPFEMQIRVRVQDLFGKWYQAEMRALS
jgi:hypothetical protein